MSPVFKTFILFFAPSEGSGGAGGGLGPGALRRSAGGSGAVSGMKKKRGAPKFSAHRALPRGRFFEIQESRL